MYSLEFTRCSSIVIVTERKCIFATKSNSRYVCSLFNIIDKFQNMILLAFLLHLHVRLSVTCFFFSMNFTKHHCITFSSLKGTINTAHHQRSHHHHYHHHSLLFRTIILIQELVFP